LTPPLTAGFAAHRINSIGQLGGLISPYMVGKVKDVTGSASMGLYALAAALVVSAVIIAWCLPRRYYVRTEV
jgi:nitrate/nitrite transporter NarK